jgi:murein DD-endopeptidase MepM/ murein hydrolase activator NlpD
MAAKMIFQPKQRIRLKRPRRARILIPIALAVLVLILAAVSAGRHWIDHSGPKDLEIALQGDADSSPSTPLLEEDVRDDSLDVRTAKQNKEHPPSPEQERIRIVEKTVQPGETITTMLSDYLQPVDVYALSREAKDTYPVHKIKAGQPYRLKICADDRLQSFEYEIDAEHMLCVAMSEGGFDVATKPIEYDVRTVIVEGEIESSLFEAVTDAGESAYLAVTLADIFAWDIDFIRDIRQGDSFRLVVEKRYRDEEFSGYGPVVAAKFTNKGQPYQAYLFATEDGRKEYFNAQGQAVRKTFLKAPLHFTRISSGYTHRRKHPILNVVRPHLGIDYAAPRGTPVKSVADGTVIAKAYQRNGGGRYLKIRHPNGYITVYMHLYKFASGIQKGCKVTQGQTIAYVGSSGLSTGPHLDFRVQKNGSYINPLKIDSQPARPIPKGEMARFQRAISPLQAVLEGKNPLYAQSDSGSDQDRAAQF